MEHERDWTAVAYKMIATFGDQAAEKIDLIVADRLAAKEAEGAVFWEDVGNTARRLQAGISIAREGKSECNR